MEVDKELLADLMAFLDMVSYKARAIDAVGTLVLDSRLKHLRHESRWAYYGLLEYLESEPKELELLSLEKWLFEYFDETDPESSKNKLVRLVVSALMEGRIPTEEEICVCYGIRYSFWDECLNDGIFSR